MPTSRNRNVTVGAVAAALLASVAAGCSGTPVDLGGGERPLGSSRSQPPAPVARAPHREPGASTNLLRASR